MGCSNSGSEYKPREITPEEKERWEKERAERMAQNAIERANDARNAKEEEYL